MSRGSYAYVLEKRLALMLKKSRNFYCLDTIYTQRVNENTHTFSMSLQKTPKHNGLHRRFSVKALMPQPVRHQVAV